MVLYAAKTEQSEPGVARAEGIALIFQKILKYLAKNIIQDKTIAIVMRRV